MRHRNRCFRSVFGVGRRQAMFLGMMDRFGRPSFSAGDKPGSGPGGKCIWPSCSATVSHTIGEPCNKISCPKCGTTMTRE